MDYEDVGDIPMMSPVGRRNNPKADDGIPLPPPPLAAGGRGRHARRCSVDGGAPRRHSMTHAVSTAASAGSTRALGRRIVTACGGSECLRDGAS